MITNCTVCGKLYEERSEDDACDPDRICLACHWRPRLTPGQIAFLAWFLSGFNGQPRYCSGTQLRAADRLAEKHLCRQTHLGKFVGAYYLLTPLGQRVAAALNP